MFRWVFSRENRVQWSDHCALEYCSCLYNLLAKLLKEGRLTNNVYKEWVTVPREWTLREIEIDLDATLVTRDSSFVDDCLKKKKKQISSLYVMSTLETEKGNNNEKKINKSILLLVNSNPNLFVFSKLSFFALYDIYLS